MFTSSSISMSISSKLYSQNFRQAELNEHCASKYIPIGVQLTKPNSQSRYEGILFDSFRIDEQNEPFSKFTDCKRKEVVRATLGRFDLSGENDCQAKRTLVKNCNKTETSDNVDIERRTFAGLAGIAPVVLQKRNAL